MFPYDKKKPRKPSFEGSLSDFFAEFETYMQEMSTHLEDESGSYVYGYSSYTGPDGKTVVKEYGNHPGMTSTTYGTLGTPQTTQPAPAEGNDHPYFDVLDEGDKVKVIVDLPGVDKKDIGVKSDGKTVSVKTDGERKYECSIPTPETAEGAPEKAQYKNGVLEIVYAKSRGQEDVKVE